LLGQSRRVPVCSRSHGRAVPPDHGRQQPGCVPIGLGVPCPTGVRARGEHLGGAGRRGPGGDAGPRAPAPWKALSWRIPGCHAAHSAGVFAPTVGANNDAYRGRIKHVRRLRRRPTEATLITPTGSEHPS
jgi:hypothetical protein